MLETKYHNSQTIIDNNMQLFQGDKIYEEFFQWVSIANKKKKH